MAGPGEQILYLVIGGFTGAYLQAGREKIRRIRNQVCEVMADEIRSAKLDGNINQEDGWTEWTDVDEMVKRELPRELKQEFEKYFQRVVDLDEEKEKLRYRQKNLASNFADQTGILRWEDSELKVATDTNSQAEEGDEVYYRADFNEWYSEYGPLIGELEESGEISGPRVEEAIRGHSPNNYKFGRLPETWNSVDDSNNWGELIMMLYLLAEVQEYSMYLSIFERNKRKIKKVSSRIDKWFTIIANTHIYFPYWLTIKLKAEDLKTKFLGIYDNNQYNSEV